MRRFEVPERSTVTVTLRDDDPAADVDTMVYVRDACFRFDSQVACDDDVPCAEAPDLGPCLRMPERQFRQSSLTTVLERGVYYVVADSITGTSDGITWGCGWVDLTVTITPMPE